MPMKMANFALACLLVLPISGAADTKPVGAYPIQCSPVPMIGVDDDTLPIQVSIAQFVLYQDRSFSSVLIANKGAKSISSVLVLAEYLDAGDQHILTSIYYGQNNSEARPLRSQLGLGVLKIEPIEPGHNQGISDVSEIASPHCPARAKITRVDLKFDDGSSWSKSSADWRTDPAIRETRDTSLLKFPGDLPYSFSAIVSIDGQGRATVTQTNADSQVAGWFGDQLSGWSIVPVDHGPSTTDDVKVTFWVVVHKDSEENQQGQARILDESHKPESPYVLLEIWPVKQTGRAVVYVGGIVASQYGVTGNQ